MFKVIYETIFSVKIQLDECAYAKVENSASTLVNSTADLIFHFLPKQVMQPFL